MNQMTTVKQKIKQENVELAEEKLKITGKKYNQKKGNIQERACESRKDFTLAEERNLGPENKRNTRERCNKQQVCDNYTSGR